MALWLFLLPEGHELTLALQAGSGSALCAAAAWLRHLLKLKIGRAPRVAAGPRGHSKIRRFALCLCDGIIAIARFLEHRFQPGNFSREFRRFLPGMRHIILPCGRARGCAPSKLHPRRDPPTRLWARHVRDRSTETAFIFR